MIEDIQRERRNGSIAQYARNSEVNNAQAYQYGDQQPYQPLNDDFINFNTTNHIYIILGLCYKVLIIFSMLIITYDSFSRNKIYIRETSLIGYQRLLYEIINLIANIYKNKIIIRILSLKHFYKYINCNPPPVQRRSTINDMLVNFINGVQPVQQRLDHFGGLKRVSYDDEQVRLDYPECPI